MLNLSGTGCCNSCPAASKASHRAAAVLQLYTCQQAAAAKQCWPPTARQDMESLQVYYAHCMLRYPQRGLQWHLTKSKALQRSDTASRSCSWRSQHLSKGHSKARVPAHSVTAPRAQLSRCSSCLLAWLANREHELGSVQQPVPARERVQRVCGREAVRRARVRPGAAGQSDAAAGQPGCACGRDRGEEGHKGQGQSGQTRAGCACWTSHHLSQSQSRLDSVVASEAEGMGIVCKDANILMPSIAPLQAWTRRQHRRSSKYGSRRAPGARRTHCGRC